MFIRDFIHRSALAFPGKAAFVDGEHQLTWPQIDERSDRFAVALEGLGVVKDDAVGLLSYEYMEVMEHWFACCKIGARRTGINWRYSERELLHIVADSNLKVLLVSAECVPLIAEHLDDFRGRGIKLIGYRADHGLDYDYETLLAGSDGVPQWPELDDADIAMISYTSGTTGLPKGAMLTQGAVRESLVHTALALGVNAEDIFFMPGTTPGVPILLNSFGLVSGATTVLPNGLFTPERYLQAIEDHQVTFTGGVPTMLLRVLEVKAAGNYDVSSVRSICYGSSPATPSLIRDLYANFNCDLVQFYGLTETTGGWLTFLRHQDHLRALEGEEHLLTSCGRASPHVEISVRTAGGEELPPNEVGEVWVRGEILTAGYLNRPEDNAELFRGDWISTHDMGKKDEEGFLYLTDRKKFLIITGAFNVYPVVIENVLAEHPAVREVAVIGAPHPDWGEAVVGAVSLNPGAEVSGEELIEFCRDKVGKWEVPKFIDIIDELPHGSTNKIAKHQVRQWYREDPQRLPWDAPT